MKGWHISKDREKDRRKLRERIPMQEAIFKASGAQLLSPPLLLHSQWGKSIYPYLIHKQFKPLIVIIIYFNKKLKITHSKVEI